jgi:hypothetical protein
MPKADATELAPKKSAVDTLRHNIRAGGCLVPAPRRSEIQSQPHFFGEAPERRPWAEKRENQPRPLLPATPIRVFSVPPAAGIPPLPTQTSILSRPRTAYPQLQASARRESEKRAGGYRENAEGNDRGGLHHNKQWRHDLRQLGLALVVSEEGQIPLGHVLYEGSRVDVRSFHTLLKPVRDRLRTLCPQPQQLTLVFDQGAESAANLEQARQLGLAYVTALKPSHHRDWLREDAGQLEPVVLSMGQEVKAKRRQRLVHGVEQTVVTVFSPPLYEGQRRGLEQHLQRALQQIAKISSHPREGVEGARRQVERIVNRQYVRQVLHCEITERKGAVTVQPRIDEAARRKLEQEYFGMRLLATMRADWTTEQIIEAYRGQSRVERAFRDLKDPWVCAFRPQYHWTDQKLIVHALIAVLSLLLGRVLLRRAQQRIGYRGTLRHLIQKLNAIRTCTVLEQQPGRGRPQLHQQLEECDAELTRWGKALGAIRKP